MKRGALMTMAIGSKIRLCFLKSLSPPMEFILVMNGMIYLGMMTTLTMMIIHMTIEMTSDMEVLQVIMETLCHNLK